MQHHLVRRPAQGVGHRLARPCGNLGGRPDLDLAVSDLGGGVHRLQRCVGQVGGLVGGLNLPRGLVVVGAQGRTHLAVGRADLRVGRVQGRLQASLDLAGAGSHRRRRPLRRQRPHALEGAPGVRRDHGHGGVQLYDLAHAVDRHRRRLVHRRQLAAIGGALADRSAEHVRQAHVDPERRFAAGLGDAFQRRQRLANVAPRGQRLQRRLGRRRAGGRLAGQFGIGQARCGAFAGDRAEGGLALALGAAPAPGRRRGQLRPRRGRRLAKLAPVGPDRRAAAGADAKAGVERRLVGNLFDDDLVPGDVQLVGQDLGLAGLGALAHFAGGRVERDLAVRRDLDPRRQLRRIRRRGALRPERQGEGAGRRPGDETPTIKRHDRLPYCARFALGSLSCSPSTRL